MSRSAVAADEVALHQAVLQPVDQTRKLRRPLLQSGRTESQDQRLAALMLEVGPERLVDARRSRQYCPIRSAGAARDRPRRSRRPGLPPARRGPPTSATSSRSCRGRRETIRRSSPGHRRSGSRASSGPKAGCDETESHPASYLFAVAMLVAKNRTALFRALLQTSRCRPRVARGLAGDEEAGLPDLAGTEPVSRHAGGQNEFATACGSTPCRAPSRSGGNASRI